MTMLEKRGTIILTEDEFNQIMEGNVPIRILNEWSLTLDELLDIINKNNYQISGRNSN